MKFPISIIEHCLQGQGSICGAPNDNVFFSYATTAAGKSLGASVTPLALSQNAAEAEQKALLASVGDCTLSISTALSPAEAANLINAKITELRDWNEQMSMLIESGCTTQMLLDTSEAYIGRYIGLSDAMYARVATTPNIPPIDEMSRSLVEKGSYSSEKLVQIERLAASDDWLNQQGTVVANEGNLINPLPNANRIFRLNGHYAAHLVMVSEEAITPYELFLFDILASKIGACLDRFWRKQEVYTEPSSVFLKSIMSDHIHDVTAFQHQAHKFDLPLTGVFELAAIGNAEERGGIAHIARQIKVSLKSCRIIIEGGIIYVLIIESEKSSGGIAAMEQQLFEIVDRLQAFIGLSSRFDDLSECHMARLEADVALQYGPKNSPKYAALASEEQYLHCVFRFKRYFPCYLVDPEADTANFLASFRRSNNVVNKLKNADRENNTNDFGLLKVYLYFDCSIKKTCELLHMHRNTVAYRLEKIRSDYYIDLDDSDTRLFLHYLFGVMD